MGFLWGTNAFSLQRVNEIRDNIRELLVMRLYTNGETILLFKMYKFDKIYVLKEIHFCVSLVHAFTLVYCRPASTRASEDELQIAGANSTRSHVNTI
jgi:hypothetical protein